MSGQTTPLDPLDPEGGLDAKNGRILCFVVSSPKYPRFVPRKKKYSRVKILPDGREIRRGYQYEKRRREVLRRDRYECVRCGSVDRLEVHHVCKRSIERDDRIGALETLCYSCHLGEHKADLFGR